MAMTKRHLSGSTDGLPISVTATATPGTLIHTALAGTLGFDEVYFTASNISDDAVTLTVEWGGTGGANHLVEEYVLPPRSAPYPIATGYILNNAKIARAFASVTAVVNIVGYVHRIQQ